MMKTASCVLPPSKCVLCEVLPLSRREMLTAANLVQPTARQWTSDDLAITASSKPLPTRRLCRVVQAECCGIMGVVSTEHASGSEPAVDARALLLEVRGRHL